MSKAGKAIRECFFDSISDAAQLLRLFDFLPDTYLYVKDIDGRFVAMNETQVRMKEVKDQSELWGKTDLDLHSLHWGRLYQQEDRKVMESGRELPDQIWLVSTADGSLGTFCSSKIPVRSRTGEVIGIAGVMYRIDQPRNQSPPDDPIRKATDLMATRYADPLEVRDVAARVGLSTSQLNRRFRSAFQMPPSEYLQRVRVHEASRRLVDGDGPISDIALECGFYDQAHLTRTFRRWMGMTPKDFRRLSQ
jgi:AraC-like DNA-binding protein